MMEENKENGVLECLNIEERNFLEGLSIYDILNILFYKAIKIQEFFYVQDKDSNQDCILSVFHLLNEQSAIIKGNGELLIKMLKEIYGESFIQNCIPVELRQTISQIGHEEPLCRVRLLKNEQTIGTLTFHEYTK